MRIRTRSAVSALLAGCLALAAAASSGDEARYSGSYTWRWDDPLFGGFSGLEISADGRRFTAISDRSAIVSGRILRENGQITGIEADEITRLRNPDGEVPTTAGGDSEGLAIRDDGRIYVSYEGKGRVWTFVTLEQAAWLPRAEGFSSLQPNSGLEALAIDGRGRLYTLPERSGELTQPFPVWRYDANGWTQPFDIPRRGGFLAVGADIGPDGRFYLLERVFTGYAFRSRVRRFDMTETALTNEVTLFESPILRHDNLEGLAVWRDDSGAIRLTMISDDNFNLLQRTELVEYAVPETLASPSDKP
ncbi:MAG: hypothetical protein CML50_19845 [Rhodobacteraceae bacterium]|jgi:hypothetical protein|uniref:Phytase-like domain-containing protein n=1 Tax=Salipiger profundus TaxID=1229727 RepID=A0A1U7D1U9_9RHOB|nr:MULTISPECIES: esterase-like activity of phytase family protein [Salipiger]APX22083.1 hypothetical protein Ga0080559_TMP1287 [Salipiger profundus]MAB08252.1 hypothetical protein [Paracoccaceae bacterium]GGA07420.1 hypothetical protein GCM10011326_19010 [Salipiger profundus]SFC44182.1 hypothetical protein SAMN05444415_103270 [Salipiger profundus]